MLMVIAAVVAVKDAWNEWWPVVLPILGLVLVATVTGIFQIATRRGGEKKARKSPLPPTWPEMWARIDGLEKRVASLEKDKEELIEANTDLTSERDEMREYIAALEELKYPAPPGLPDRRKWLTVQQEKDLAVDALAV